MATLNKIKVNQVQAADPGVAFVLAAYDENGNPIAFNCGLQVRIQIAAVWPSGSYTYESDVTIWNPISDRSLVFAVPYGDPNFGSETTRSYTITLYTTPQGENGSQDGFSRFSNVENAAGSIQYVPGSFTLSTGSITF
jgi:hypothetical protein